MGRKNLLGAMNAVIAPDKPQVWRGELKKANVTEYHRNWMRAKRARNGGMQAAFSFDVEGAAALTYLKQQWGFPTTKEACEVALRYLAQQTRAGLEHIHV